MPDEEEMVTISIIDEYDNESFHQIEKSTLDRIIANAAELGIPLGVYFSFFITDAIDALGY